MTKRLVILIRRSRRPIFRRIAAAVWAALVLAGGAALLVLMLPVIGLILAVALGVVLGVVLLAGLAAIIFGWKLRRAIRGRRQDATGPGQGDPPRKKVKVDVHIHD